MQDGRESVLAVFPFFHSFGWTGVQHLSILAGWTDILVPHPEPQAIIEIMRKHTPTLLPAIPTVFKSLLAREEFRRMKLSSLKGFLSGAAPLPPSVINELKALKDNPVINIYGLAETCLMGTATPWSGPEKPGTVGLPLPGADVRIVDAETGTRVLPAGEAGEICFKGPQVMKGYYKKPE
ncbi:MAG TPA: long-chain fatty acid--CoA ligase, partial [Candidatus Rokubacteria bacterium]|nr:long-chain fatty acid--CoA ligase [Candidatus Rokubacteria bacterium]